MPSPFSAVESPLQLQKLLVQPRLRHKELLCRLGDALLLRNGNDVLQLFKIHKNPPFNSMNSNFALE